MITNRLTNAGIRFFSMLIVLAFVVPFSNSAVAQNRTPPGNSILAANSLNSSYSQNFDTLANSGTGITWTNDTTISGWYSTRNTYNAGSGTSTTGSLYSFGTGTSTERALGSLASGGTGTVRYGLRLINDTGSTVTAITVSYTGEQWRNGGNTTQHTLSFAYQIGATVIDLTSGTWTPVTALNFTGPIATSTASALDGNASENHVAISASFAVSIAPNQEIMLRWSDPDDSGNDHGLAIDDLTVTATAGDAAPTVSSTTPTDSATGIAVDANIGVTFSEAVNVAGAWYLISCASSGMHTAAVSGGPTTFTLNPDSDFANGESCTVTLYATQITDQDTDDPPDHMATDYSWSFTVVSTSAGWIINEIHADPDATAGDANGDGTVNTSQDEFVEIFNNTGSSVDISGWTLADGYGTRHTFPSGAIVPDQCAVVVFGGGTPTGAFGYTVVQTASTGQLGLNNDGDTIALREGATVYATYTYGSEGGDNQSLTRSPDLTGNFAKHTTATGSGGTRFSPGTQVDGTVFSGCSGSGSIGVCGDGTETAIHTIQGDGASSPLAGTSGVVIEGIVIGDFQNTTTELRGFFVQEESTDMDGDVNTSEGIFVYDNGFGVDVNVGDVVRVLGNVTEYSTLTEINNITAIEVCGTGATPSMVDVTLPFASATDLEKYEGMLVTFPQILYVSGNYQLGRYGEVVLSSGARLDIPTNVVTPGAPAIALQAQNDLNQILLDDDNLLQNVDPIDHPAPGLTASNTLRSGDTVSNLVGVVSYSWSGYSGTDNYRIHPVGVPNFVQSNPRSAVLTSDSSQVRVASFNVLNYFVTFGSRGADNQTEFDRQRAKIISAIVTLDADVIGLMEMENHSTDAALQDLVNGLNTAAGAGTYAYVNTGVLGTDAIKVALIYKPGRVSLIGSELTNTDAVFSRPPLAQTFEQAGTSARFTVVVNHFKSKGCSGATGSDADLGDGQGCYNATRVNQANALTAWINATVIPNTLGANGDPDVLIIGDLNAYAMEDPITAIKGAGYVDMINTFIGSGAYSYVFDNQSGYLDHALASNSLAPWVADVQEWHINADEPIVLDYNTDYKTTNQLTTLYAPDAYRASDHDPVLVLLDFVNVYVDDDYTISTLGWDVNRFSAIQSGIDAAAVGDTVYVENLTAGAGETYAESVTLSEDVSLVIRDAIRLNGALTIAAGDVVAPAGTLTLAGNFTHNAGSFNHNAGTVVFDGAGPWAYTGSGTTFYNLAVNAGTVLDVGPGFAVASSVTNNGGLRQTQTVNNPSSPIAFLNISADKYYGVAIATAGNMGATTVIVYGNQACVNASSPTVNRCYDISPATPAAADITFYYLNTEANGQIAPIIWHWSGAIWENEAFSERGTTGTDYAWVTATGIDSYSDFSASDEAPGPTAITLTAFTAAPQDNAVLVAWETASELENVGFNLHRSETAAGPYTQLNAGLIPPQFPGEVMGGAYEWLDTDVLPGVTYFYKLEDIDVKGVSTFHGPIGAVIVTAPTVVALQSVSARSALLVTVILVLSLAGLTLTRGRRR